MSDNTTPKRALGGHDLKDGLSVVIRSVGERTEQACRKLIIDQGVPAENIQVIHEAPFSAAMSKSFEIGMDCAKPWTFCVDADLLLRPGAIQTMLRHAEELEDGVCEFQGLILDKLFGGPRDGGIHAYRTSLLPLLLQSIPSEGVNIRPEFHTLQAMKALGHPWVSVPYIVGLHDFEQHHRDIFRKCFVQAHKHPHVIPLFLSIWRAGAPEDTDFQMALQGLAAGIAHHDTVLIDTRQKVYAELFAALKVDEKPPLPEAGISLAQVEGIIADWREPDLYYRYMAKREGVIHHRKTEA